MNETREEKIIPTITVGRYAGTKIDKLPNSYLRWMMTQDFPKLWLDCAKEKLEESDYNNIHTSISRHAIDMFSKRFLHVWLKYVRIKGDEADGIGTFITNLAEEAWKDGIDISKHRYEKDGIIKEFQGMRFVFNVSKEFPEYKDVITIMTTGEK